VGQEEDITATIVDGEPGASRRYRADDTFVDGLLGLRYSGALPGRWSYEISADVSTGGTELTWSVNPSIGYTFGANGQFRLTAGYRYLAADFDTKPGVDMDDVDVALADAELYALIEKVRRHETIYKQAGAVHGCALATLAGEILMFVEDVGRHNAVDAIAGFMWLDGIDGSDKVFYTTGRLTSEMVIKCAQMRIPFLVSRSGLTQMGHQIAQKTGITMLGRASGRHYLAFTGRQRLVRTAPQPTALA